MALTPFGYRVIIKHKEVEQVTKGGIYLPDPVREGERYKTCTGIVVSKGADAETEAEVGDTVLYAQQGGRFITDPESGLEYTILNDEDILCRVDEFVIQGE